MNLLSQVLDVLLPADLAGASFAGATSSALVVEDQSIPVGQPEELG
jgi:hypothetical protein